MATDRELLDALRTAGGGPIRIADVVEFLPPGARLGAQGAYMALAWSHADWIKLDVSRGRVRGDYRISLLSAGLQALHALESSVAATAGHRQLKRLNWQQPPPADGGGVREPRRPIDDGPRTGGAEADPHST